MMQSQVFQEMSERLKMNFWKGTRNREMLSVKSKQWQDLHDRSLGDDQLLSWNHPSDTWAPTENPLRTAGVSNDLLQSLKISYPSGISTMVWLKMPWKQPKCHKPRLDGLYLCGKVPPPPPFIMNTLHSSSIVKLAVIMSQCRLAARSNFSGH